MNPTPPSGQPEHYVLKPTGGATQFVAERSPSGPYGELREAAEKAASRRIGYWCAGYALQEAHPIYVAALEAKDRQLANLREALEPGKASAIINAMFAAAERLGHPPASAKHALTFFLEHFEAKDREIERLTAADIKAVATVIEERDAAEQREAEAVRHLIWALDFAGAGRLARCCTGPSISRTDGGFGFRTVHTEDCPLVAAKNFLESKPLEATVEGED